MGSWPTRYILDLRTCLALLCQMQACLRRRHFEALAEQAYLIGLGDILPETGRDVLPRDASEQDGA